MGILTYDRASLAATLGKLDHKQRGAFAASCAQRLSRCFINPRVRHERPQDVELAEQALDELWASATGGDGRRLPAFVAALDRTPELTADEKWLGPAAWQMDALQALFYAGRSWEEPTPEPVLQCADCSTNGAYFLDEALPERGGTGDADPLTQPVRYFEYRELERQRDDMAQILSSDTKDWRPSLREMRARSDAYAQEFFTALETLV
jgi:hypothetical protein